MAYASQTDLLLRLWYWLRRLLHRLKRPTSHSRAAPIFNWRRRRRSVDRLAYRRDEADRSLRNQPRKNSTKRSTRQSSYSRRQRPSGVRRPLHSAPAGTRAVRSQARGLAPDTRYYYAVFDDANNDSPAATPSHHFRTHPTVGTKKPFRFWVVGDSGTGDDNQKAVYTAMQRLRRSKAAAVDFYLHVGDMAYPKGTDDEFQRNFFDIYQPTLRNTVCWAVDGEPRRGHVEGDHRRRPVLRRLRLPEARRSRRVAVGDRGAITRSTTATSISSASTRTISIARPTGVMAQWLRADLEQDQGRLARRLLASSAVHQRLARQRQGRPAHRDARADHADPRSRAASISCSPATRTFTNARC